MKAKALAIVAAATLAFTAAAVGATNTLTGSFEGDANSSISLKVKMSNKGKPKKLTEASFSNLDYTCNDKTTGEATDTIPTPIKLEKDGNRYSFYHEVPSGTVGDVFGGEVKKNGKKAEGNLYYYFTKEVIDDETSINCATGTVLFSAKK